MLETSSACSAVHSLVFGTCLRRFLLPHALNAYSPLLSPLQQHWLANNAFGLAFSLKGIEFLQLNKVSTGCILLGGLFFYDIFWVSFRNTKFSSTQHFKVEKHSNHPLLFYPSLQVFATDVMVTVAKSFEAPIKRMHIIIRL